MIGALSLRRLALVLANGGLAALLAQTWLTAPTDPRLPAVTSRAGPAASSSLPAPAVQSTARAAPQRDPFNAAVLPEAETGQQPAEDVPVEAPTVELVGIALGGKSFAVLRSGPGEATQRVAEGAHLGPWTLAAVRRNTVVLLRGETSWQIPFAPKPVERCATRACAGE